MTLTDRTEKALGSGLLRRLRDRHFSIIGCGGVGSTFAEILVRSGAQNFFLVDGDKVEESNLNRCLAFSCQDVGRNKACALKCRLLTINPHANIDIAECHFEEEGGCPRQKELREKITRRSHMVLIAADNYKSRFALEDFLLEDQNDGVDSISVSIGIYPPEAGHQPNVMTEFKCVWRPYTCRENHGQLKEGYGKENASFASVVMEASATAFRLMLRHWSGGEERSIGPIWHKDFLLYDTATNNERA